DAGSLAIEHLVDGEDPVELADDLWLIPLPGHTRGSMALNYRKKFLFTGDHMWWSETADRLYISRSVSWYSFAEQKRSTRRLLELFDQLPFEWVLPGHGRRFHTTNMRAELQRLILSF